MKIFQERFQPCCGFSLRGAVRIMAILNLLMILIGVGLIILDVFQLWDKWQIERVQALTNYYIRLAMWILYTIHVITSVPMDLVLYQCSKTEETNKLKMFYFATLANTTFALIVYYIHTFLFGIHFQSLAIYNGYIIYKYYECFVIKCYIREIEEEIEFSSAKRALTEAEMLEFQEGLSSIPPDFETKPLLEKIIYQRYKKEEFEISIDNLRFDSTNILGKGAYGCVYRAQLEKGDGYDTTVALKMIKPEEADVIYFKALLTELKIMSYLGKHENVIQFIGATTKEIRERKLYIVLEFCVFGNMTDYLRGSRSLFRSLVRNGSIQPQQESHYDVSPFSEGELISTEDLIRWSYQIACGMEFLESRKVLHGDLATRNVLLTSKRVAKITDFGLARQLYAYSVYVRKQNTPLPWRHLALESLTDMAFSSASDVWSYGITLWEIFTLGEVPWPGYDFNFMFVEELKQGLKPHMPPHATDDLYHKLMFQCWDQFPANRPSFSSISNFFTESYTKFCHQQTTGLLNR